MSCRPRTLSLVGLACVLALVLCVLTLAPSPASAHTTHATRPQARLLATHFLVTATAADERFGYSILIDNPITNNRPTLALFVTPNWNPGGACGCISEPIPLSVGYTYGWNAWLITRIDGSTFNVLAVPMGGSVFMQLTSSSNISGDSTSIDNPLTNGHPNALLLVSVGNTNSLHPVGVWYNPFLQKWAIFYEDGAPMSLFLNFYVMVGASASGGGMEFTQTATTSNTYGDSTMLNTSTTNWNSNAFVFVTSNWNPGGSCGCIYDPAEPGVSYTKHTLPAAWNVFNEDASTMPIGAVFNVLAFSSGRGGAAVLWCREQHLPVLLSAPAGCGTRIRSLDQPTCT